MSGHDEWADAAGAYVLGAMPAAERQRYEAHLSACEICREEVEELRPAAEALPVASPPVVPPARLKDRIMAEVEREAAVLAAAGADADRVPRRRRRWRLLPAAAVLLAAGVLAGVALDRDDGGRTYAVTVNREQAPGARAELHVMDGEAMLVAEGLPAPPEGRVYQVWVKRPDREAPVPTSALFLPRSDGSASAAVHWDPGDMEAVLVTHEPRGGSRAPTRTPLLSAPMS